MSKVSKDENKESLFFRFFKYICNHDLGKAISNAIAYSILLKLVAKICEILSVRLNIQETKYAAYREERNKSKIERKKQLHQEFKEWVHEKNERGEI